MDLTPLARAAARGDRHSAETLVRETLVEVWRLCHSMLGATLAEDTTQDTYLRAWRGLQRHPAPDDPRAWLMTIAYRACIDRIRQQDRQRKRLERYRAQPTATSAPPADQHIGVYDELLANLDPDRRAAFVLTQLLGYSYAETAHICQTTIGTIRSRVARARNDLIQAQHRAPHQQSV